MSTFALLPRCLSCLFLASLSAAAVENGPRPGPVEGDGETLRRFHEGLDLHQQGVDGDEDAVLDAIEIFEQLLEEHPGDARVQVFLGNLYTLRARDAIFYRKMDWLKKGLRTIDSAVAARPDDPHVRSVRAINSYQLPRIFGRAKTAAADFAILLEWAEEDPGRYDEGLLKFVYYHAGRFHADRDEEQARRLFEKALALSADSVSDAEIEDRLKDL